MSKTFSASLIVAVAALGAASLVQAQGADGPSYPALQPINSVASRTQVQAAAHDADASSAAVQYAGAADGASYPALQAQVGSQKSRADVGSEARTMVGAAIVTGLDERYGA